ncbi:DNA repair protein XRCC1 [Dermacentor albipictus]|uniref:DNA repair protein XRCC1 n=1 Tax=Dermacentor albipictus TaxID=60249 RepID=UPI0031FD5799
MPVLKIQHIVSFSSEDKVHKAENLLKPETYRKWKCATPGEKQASVILQLEKASVISSIDIGNESSAFIEVLVSRSSDPAQDFHVILVASSFMTPMDARQGTNLNRVRMFGAEKLSQSFVKEKWDRVKIVCTQPFNKSIQYGLAFIKLHSPEEMTSKAEPSPKASFGNFQLKEEEDETDLAVGAWFAKRKEKASVDSSTSPAAIKAASYASTALRTAEEKTLKPSKPASSWKASTEEPEESSSSSAPQKPQKALTVQAAPKPAAIPEAKKKPTTEKAKPREMQKPQTPKSQKKKKTKPPQKFEELMRGVVFVLSGFQNPLRSQIRDRALEMGAKYKADWDRSCTHLVCAFLNTPKYGQVKAAGGKIVTKEWVIDSYKEKCLKPWPQYKLGSYHRPSTPENDDDEDEEDDAEGGGDDKAEAGGSAAATTAPNPRGRRREESGGQTDSTKRPARDAGGATPGGKARRVEQDDKEDGDSDFDADTDVDEKGDDYDTEDEIERVRQRQKQVAEAATSELASSGSEAGPRRSGNASSRPSSETRPSIGGGGDADDASPIPLDLPELPAFFTGKSFLLYGDFPEDERRALTRYIVGHDGDLKEELDDTVKFVITKSDWNDTFDEALCANESLVFLRPRWVTRCHEASRSVPYQPFVVACPE